MRNLLLESLSPEDLDLLRPGLTQVDLPKGSTLNVSMQPVEHVHFLESGLVSMIATAGDDQIEVGVIGREGMTGISVLVGSGDASHDSRVQIEGSAYRLTADDFRAALGASPTLGTGLLRFVHVQIFQVSQTALANGRRTVESRLARWLLMTHDRIDTDDIALTHDFLAMMLGVRRPGVTVALHVLEGEGAIKSTRGSVRILNRDRLRTFAGECYGATEALYAKLFGVSVDAGSESQNGVRCRIAAASVPSSR